MKDTLRQLAVERVKADLKFSTSTSEEIYNMFNKFHSELVTIYNETKSREINESFEKHSVTF